MIAIRSGLWHDDGGQGARFFCTMTLRTYLIALAAATLVCWASFAMILFYLSPLDSSWIGPTFFFVTLFFSLIGTITLLGFSFRIFFARNEMVFSALNTSFRQGMLIALAIVGSLVLQAFRMLTWWDAALFIIALALLELFFITREQTSWR